MASLAGKYAAKKLLGKQMDKYKHKRVAGDDDPYFARVPGRNGKMKKVKKQIPDFIPEKDAKVLASAKSLAYKLDMSLFSFAGVRFGWSSVIGLIPAAGDVIDVFFALIVFNKCRGIEGGLPTDMMFRMLINIIFDFVIGLVPIIGDLADAAYRANTRNVMLLEKHLRAKHGPADKKLREEAGLELFEDDPDHPHYAEKRPRTSSRSRNTSRTRAPAPAPA